MPPVGLQPSVRADDRRPVAETPVVRDRRANVYGQRGRERNDDYVTPQPGSAAVVIQGDVSP